MRRDYMTSVRVDLNRAKKERKNREEFKGDLLVLFVALAAILAFIVII